MPITANDENRWGSSFRLMGSGGHRRCPFRSHIRHRERSDPAALRLKAGLLHFVRNDGEGVKTRGAPLETEVVPDPLRHCERSEAIYPSTDGSLRQRLATAAVPVGWAVRRLTWLAGMDQVGAFSAEPIFSSIQLQASSSAGPAVLEMAIRKYSISALIFSAGRRWSRVERMAASSTAA